MEAILRQKIGREEFDYSALMAALSKYANPRSKAGRLMSRGVIVRVKKGLYVFGDAYRRRPVSRELLANLIYGPSYVSLDSALSYHGLIPERVTAMTSVTPKRPRRFETPLGCFVYRQVSPSAFPVGMQRVEMDDVAFLIASPERALADKLRDDRGHPLRSHDDMSEYLLDDLRVEPEDLARLDTSVLDALAASEHSAKIALLVRWLRQRKSPRE
jgi:hypothetical protein